MEDSSTNMDKPTSKEWRLGEPVLLTAQREVRFAFRGNNQDLAFSLNTKELELPDGSKKWEIELNQINEDEAVVKSITKEVTAGGYGEVGWYGIPRDRHNIAFFDMAEFTPGEKQEKLIKMHAATNGIGLSSEVIPFQTVEKNLKAA